MTKTCIEPPHWDTLLERIHRRKCVPFLGAGVNASKGDEYKGLPLGGEVALRLVQRILGLREGELKDLVKVKAHRSLVNSEYYRDFTQLGLQNLARVALHFENKIDFRAFMDRLRSILPDDECEPSRPLEILARLPFELIVTTNYDRLMERALDKAGRNWEPVVQPVHGFSETEQPRLRDKLATFWGERIEAGGLPNLILYKIHGTFTDITSDGGNDEQEKDAISEKPASRIIITEDDYIEFLTVVGITDVGIPKQIGSKLIQSTLLFLGYGLEDWDFRTIYKGLIEQLERRTQLKSFAIQKKPSACWRDFWDKKNVVIYDEDLFDFADDLEQKYEEYRQLQIRCRSAP